MTRFHDPARAAFAGLLGPAVACLLTGLQQPGFLGLGAGLLALGLAALSRSGDPQPWPGSASS